MNKSGRENIEGQTVAHPLHMVPGLPTLPACPRNAENPMHRRIAVRRSGSCGMFRHPVARRRIPSRCPEAPLHMATPYPGTPAASLHSALCRPGYPDASLHKAASRPGTSSIPSRGAVAHPGIRPARCTTQQPAGTLLSFHCTQQQGIWPHAALFCTGTYAIFPTVCLPCRAAPKQHYPAAGETAGLGK
jgi:hypothetical protein